MVLMNMDADIHDYKNMKDEEIREIAIHYLKAGRKL